MSDRPIVLVDMDGPLADFDRLFYERCRDNGWPMDCTFENQSARYATDHVIDTAHRRSARAMVDQAGWFADLPVVDGAVGGLQQLARRAEVWICTKPLEANTTCRDDKGRWVARHLGTEFERRLIITPDKSLIRGAILLDDAPFLDWLDQATWLPVIFPTSWNRDGSPWAHLPAWTWGDPVDLLIAGADV